MKLSQKSIDIVKSEMKGKRLEKFLNSVRSINDSLDAGGWLPKVSRSSNSGFYQGCGIDAQKEEDEFDIFPLYMTLKYGHGFDGNLEELESMIKMLTKETLKNHSLKFVRAWVELCNQKTVAIEHLDSLRPLTVLTKIGLSRKVTTTLKEMNLDIDIPSIKRAEIDYKFIPMRDLKGELMYGREGECLLDKRYYVKWSKGIIHRQSRFNLSGTCHACGKTIPSCRFVPIEAFDNKSKKLVSFWVGCDCAKNIFGIKDVGISQD